MGKMTGISWTSATWNPWQGCHKVSPGCKHCYMFQEKTRYRQEPNTVIRSKPATFNAPLKWTIDKVGTPFRVFTCSWSDFFIEEADEWREQVLLIMARTPHLTYQVLTKRAERVPDIMQAWYESYIGKVFPQPLPNVWLGVSAENQAMADERIPWVLQAPAAVRFVSYEPALGPVDFRPYMPNPLWDELPSWKQPAIDWIIAGGESGPKARGCDVAWLRSVKDQCAETGVACWVKQYGSKPYQSPRHDGGPGYFLQLKDRKGADPAEWDEDMRVQQFPEAAHV